ncbi:hypothetical protein Syun_019476 [Stephania yunnanensis]|uniref:Uncharacterized protein n=1 Tax=Stephania yunnanensis TaxID=152371 RepID=A0AAP0IU90_9MAGN
MLGWWHGDAKHGEIHTHLFLPCAMDVVESSDFRSIILFKDFDHRLRERRLYAKFSKCEFWRLEVKRSGHVINDKRYYRRLYMTSPKLQRR